MPDELSGKEQQRIIMRAIIGNKNSIDGRTFSALDAISRKQLTL